jgi:predicted secreted protein
MENVQRAVDTVTITDTDTVHWHSYLAGVKGKRGMNGS